MKKQVANVSQTEEVPVTDEEEMEQTPTPATEVFTAAETFFGTLAKTLADKEKTEQLASTLIEKDSITGKRYLKIPVENEQIIEKAADTLIGLLSILKKQ